MRCEILQQTKYLKKKLAIGASKLRHIEIHLNLTIRMCNFCKKMEFKINIFVERRTVEIHSNTTK